MERDPPPGKKQWPLMFWFPDTWVPPDVADKDVPAPPTPIEWIRSMNDEDRKRFAGLFRLWLGLAQMAGATIAALLLWDTGLSSATIFAVILTTALTVLSVMLYLGRRKSSV